MNPPQPQPRKWWIALKGAVQEAEGRPSLDSRQSWPVPDRHWFFPEVSHLYLEEGVHLFETRPEAVAAATQDLQNQIAALQQKLNALES